MDGVSEGKVQLFEFLRMLKHQGQSLMLNREKVTTVQQLAQALLRADRYLDECDDEVSNKLYMASRLSLPVACCILLLIFCMFC